jgi:hypothetical protein
MQHTNEKKGSKVKPTDRSANTASTPKTGLFATLCGLLHISGTGASKIIQGTGAPGGLLKDRMHWSITRGDRARFAYNRSPRLRVAGTERRARGAQITRARARGARSPRALAGLVSLCALFGALVFNSPALAANGHVFSSEFGGACTGAGGTCEPGQLEKPLSDPSGIAVNNATGDLYVIDKGNNRVEEFNPTGTKVIAEFSGKGTAGELSEPEAIAIDNSGETASEDPSLGDLYVTDHNVVDKFSATGEFEGQITGTCEQAGEVPSPSCKAFAGFATLDGVAVDPKGQVWVYQQSAEIDAFRDAKANAFLSSRKSAVSLAQPGLAVDSEDNLYVAWGSEDHVAKLNSAGKALQRPLGEGDEGRTGIAVEPSSNDVYIDSANPEGTPAIQVYTSSETAPNGFTSRGVPVETFGETQLADRGGTALAVSDAVVSNGDVYVLDSSAGKVDIFTHVTPKVTAHALSSSFTGAPTHALSEPAGIAVNDGTEDVYVVDKGNKRVEEFTKEGVFLAAFTPPAGFEDPEAIAVDNTGNPLDPSENDVYVTDQRTQGDEPGYAVDKFSDTGAYEGQLRRCPEDEFTNGQKCEPAGHPTLPFVAISLTGVAVGPEGNVWVSTSFSYEGLNEFSDTGTFERYVDTGRLGVGGLAVGAEENGEEIGYFNYLPYLNEGSKERAVLKFDFSSGAALGEEFSGGGVSAEALDPATGDLFVDKENGIERYAPVDEPKPNPLETFRSSGLADSQGIAVSSVGTVYATERAADEVEVFDEFPLAQVKVGAVSGLTPASVTLQGSVNPEGAKVDSCEFEYGTTTAYGQIAECEPGAGALGEGTEAVPVSAKLSGLASGTTYHYRLVASDAYGTNAGVDQTFVTPGPTISEEQVNYVEATHATLAAQIDANGDETTYHFEYDTRPYGEGEVAHGTSLPVPSASIGSGRSGVPVSVRAQDLQPGTAYYYRAVADGEPLGTPESFDGPNETFTTNPEPGSAPPQNCANEQRRAEQPFGLGLPDCRAYEMVSPVDTEGQNATDAGKARVARAAAEGAPAQSAAEVAQQDEGGAVTYATAGAFAGTSAVSPGAVTENQYVSRRDPEADGWSTQAITPLHEPQKTEAVGSYVQDAFNPELTEGIALTNASLTEGGGEGLYLANFADRSYREIVREGDALPLGVSSDLSHVVFGQGGEVFESTEGAPSLVGVDNGDELVLADVAGWRAVSGTGSNVAFTQRDGQLYVRVNADQLQSPVSQPEAEGSGTLTKGSTTVSELVVASGATSEESHGPGTIEMEVTPLDGRFVIGQPISGPGIEAGSTITAIVKSKEASSELLTLSKPTAGEVPAGRVLSSGGPVPFVVGDRVSGAGIPVGTTVTGVAKGSLTLSVAASASETGGQLVEGGGCTVSTDACTVEASASQREAENPAGAQPVQYQGASVDGSRVFFTSKAELTEDAYTGPQGSNAADLYEYDIQSGKLTDLTVDDEAATDGAAVQGVVQISEDASYLYFVAKGVLSGANAQHRSPTGGAENLYVSHEDRISLIATLGGGDGEVWEPGSESNLASVSPNGQWLSFLSKESLTGYDNEQAHEGECKGETGFANQSETGPCQEAYLYDAGSGAGSGSLVCASCNRTGARPVGPANLGEPRGGQNLYRPRVVTNDGRLFFASYDALVPHSSDGRQNVYEYEHGQIYPISDVAGGFESFLLDTSASGGDVYFATSDQLLPEDTSNNVVVYDARIDGGFPVAVAAPPCTTAEACRVATAPAPSIYGPPPSATFSGPGNLVAPAPAIVPVKKKTVPKCKKGFAKNKKGKCVKTKRKTKSKKAKKATNDRRASR